MSQSVIKNYSDFEDAAKTVPYEHLRAVSCRAAMRVLVAVKRFLDERDNAQYHHWALASFRDLIHATCESISPGQVISQNYISFTERHAASDLSFLCENDEAFGFAYLSCFRATVDVTRQELLQRNAVSYHSKAIEIWSHGDRARKLKQIFLPVMIDLSNCRKASHPQEIYSMHELGIGGGIGVEVAYGPSDLLIALRDAGPDWAFWREWYQGFLTGQPLDWELQRRVALIDDDIWEAGPEAVAAEIERIRGEFDIAPPTHEPRQPDFEPDNLDSLIKNKIIASAQTLQLGAQISDAFARFHAETGANQLPEMFEPLQAMPMSLGKISAVLRHEPFSTDIEQELREEIGRLNAKVAQLERELRKALDAEEAIFAPAFKKQVATSLGDWKLYAALGAGLWMVSGDTLGVQQRLENILALRDAFFGEDCPTPAPLVFLETPFTTET